MNISKVNNTLNFGATLHQNAIDMIISQRPENIKEDTQYRKDVQHLLEHINTINNDRFEISVEQNTEKFYRNEDEFGPTYRKSILCTLLNKKNGELAKFNLGCIHNTDDYVGTTKNIKLVDFLLKINIREKESQFMQKIIAQKVSDHVSINRKRLEVNEIADQNVRENMMEQLENDYFFSKL